MKDKLKVLFKIGFVYHKAAFDPVIDLLMTDDRYDIWFSLEYEKKRKFIFDFTFHPPVIKEWEKQGYRFTNETKGFDVVITGDTLRDSSVYGETMLCFLNHGTGIKNILYRNLQKSAHDKYQVFVEGQHRVDSIKKYNPQTKSDVRLIGLPKLDYYFQGKYNDTVSILKKLDLDPDKKTILFAPTYKPTCLYDIKDDLFEQTKEYNLIIKLHPYSWMGKYAPHKQHKIYEKRVSKYPHAVLLPFDHYNIVPYYSVADTLLSEASSTVFDFLALGKTGIVFDLPCDKLSHSDGTPLLEIDNREFLKGAFLHIDSGKQINEAVKLALNPTDEMIKAADVYRDQLFYNLDGNAGRRMIDVIEKLYHEGGYENKP